MLALSVFQPFIPLFIVVIFLFFLAFSSFHKPLIPVSRSGYRTRCSDSLCVGLSGARTLVEGDVFSYPYPSRPIVSPTQPPTRSLPGLKRCCIALTIHPYLAPSLKMSRAIPLHSLRASCGNVMFQSIPFTLPALVLH